MNKYGILLDCLITVRDSVEKVELKLSPEMKELVEKQKKKEEEEQQKSAAGIKKQ